MIDNIEFGTKELVDVFENEVNQILIKLGHPEAFVTDESQLSDFLPMIPSKMRKCTLSFPEIMELRKEGKDVSEFYVPIEYTNEDEDEAQLRYKEYFENILNMFAEYDVILTSTSKIGELARILATHKKISFN